METFLDGISPLSLDKDDSKIYPKCFSELYRNDNQFLSYCLVGLVGNKISSVGGLIRIYNQLNQVQNEFISGMKESIKDIISFDLNLKDEVDSHIDDDNNEEGELVEINSKGKIVKLHKVPQLVNRRENIINKNDQVIDENILFDPKTFCKTDSKGIPYETYIALRPHSEYKLLLLGLSTMRLKSLEVRRNLIEDLITNPNGKKTEITPENISYKPLVAISNSLQKSFQKAR